MTMRKARMNNRMLTERGYVFRKACELAGIEPTVRQASKYRSKRGMAYRFKEQAKSILAEEARNGGKSKADKPVCDKA